MTEIEISKKTVWIGFGTLVLTILIFGGAYFLVPKISNDVPQSPSDNQEQTKSAITAVLEKDLFYEDPLGFSFSYPESSKLDKHPEDTVNYANVEIIAKDRIGKVKIVVSDMKEKDIASFIKKDTDMKLANVLDSKLGTMDAKKAYIDSTKKIVTAMIWDGMLFKMEVMPADNQEAVRLGDKILASMKVLETANYTDSSVASSGGGANVADDAGSGDEEVIE
jgi:hypothetical protein